MRNVVSQHAVLELGPGPVRRVMPKGAPPQDCAAMAAATECIDDAVALVNGRPTDVVSLWQRIIGSLCGPNCGSLLIVHPTWWPGRRVQRMVDISMQSVPGARVVAVARSRVSIGHAVDRQPVVIEVGERLISICSGAGLVTVLDSASSPEFVVDTVSKVVGEASHVLIDVPIGISHAGEWAASVRGLLSDIGVDVTQVCLDQAVAEFGARPSRHGGLLRLWAGTPALVRRRLVSTSTIAVTSLLVVTCGIGFVVAHTRGSRPVSSPGSAAGDRVTNLIEGRVALRIPSDWNIERLTAGPGSRRVRISSPAETGLVVHVTQSYAPGETLRGAAGALERAIGAESTEVFGDFNPHGERAGRSAVTYRETRLDRVIAWTVLVDGSMRIGIGCQTQWDREGDIEEICDDAVQSAHEVRGTEAVR